MMTAYQYCRFVKLEITMRLKPGEFVRPIIKLLPLALLLPIITGFAGPAPDSSATNAPEAIAAPTSQPPLPTTLAPGVDGAGFNWRRDKNPEPGANDSAAADTSVLKADFPSGTVHSWETGANKSYLIPALEIPGFLVLLNVYDRFAYSDQMQDGKKVYRSTFTTSWDHLRKQHWVFDQDPFNINQFAHPYQGATMYGLARSTGLDFWE